LPHVGGSLVDAPGGSNTPRAESRQRRGQPLQRRPKRSARPEFLPGPGLGSVLHLGVLDMERLVVRGATQHNLKSVSCDLPQPAGGHHGAERFGQVVARLDTSTPRASAAMSNPCPPSPAVPGQLPKPRSRASRAEPRLASSRRAWARARARRSYRHRNRRLPAPALRAASAFALPQVGKVLRAYTVQEIVDEILGRGAGDASRCSHHPRARRSGLTRGAGRLRRDGFVRARSTVKHRLADELTPIHDSRTTSTSSSIASSSKTAPKAALPTRSSCAEVGATGTLRSTPATAAKHSSQRTPVSWNTASPARSSRACSR